MLYEVITHLHKISSLGTVNEGVTGTLFAIWRLSAAMEQLTALVLAFNEAHPPSHEGKPMAKPRLVPLVPMAPVRPGFMNVPDSLHFLNPGFLQKLGVHPKWHATKRMTNAEREDCPDSIRNNFV